MMTWWLLWLNDIVSDDDDGNDNDGDQHLREIVFIQVKKTHRRDERMAQSTREY